MLVNCDSAPDYCLHEKLRIVCKCPWFAFCSGWWNSLLPVRLAAAVTWWTMAVVVFPWVSSSLTGHQWPLDQHMMDGQWPGQWAPITWLCHFPHQISRRQRVIWIHSSIRCISILTFYYLAIRAQENNGISPILWPDQNTELWLLLWWIMNDR